MIDFNQQRLIRLRKHLDKIKSGKIMHGSFPGARNWEAETEAMQANLEIEIAHYARRDGA